MITIRKLSSLGKKTALRKIVSLLTRFEADLAAGRAVDTAYLSALIGQIVAPADPELEKSAADMLSRLSGGAAGAAKNDPVEFPALQRICNDLRHQLSAYLGIRPADWDFMPPAGYHGPGPGAPVRTVLPIRVFLEDLRSPFNVGSVFRSAESFCVEQVTLTPSCPRPDHPRAARSAMGSDLIVPWRVDGLESLVGKAVFALETGGTPIDEFEFPGEGTVILGNEELGVSPEGLELARGSAGIVSIPLFGLKGSLNVTAAFAILVYLWCTRVRAG